MSVHAKIDPIFHAWYTYIKKIYKKKIKVKIAIEKFWCVKYYKAQPYNMEHTLCVCVRSCLLFLFYQRKKIKNIFTKDEFIKKWAAP